MSEAIAFIAGVILCRAIIGPIPYRVQNDIRTASMALSHMSDTTRRILTTLQGIERQMERQVEYSKYLDTKNNTPKILGK